MSSKRRNRWVAACFLVWLVVGAGPPVRAASKGKEAALLADANQRWGGASCRSLQDIRIKKKAGKGGWTASNWLFWEARGNSRLRVWFGDGKAIHREYSNGVVPAGTEFTAAGWRVEKPGGKLFLQLEEKRTGVGAKVYFWDAWVGKVSAKRVPEFERWARLNLFEILVAADEVLVEEPVAATAPSPARAPIAATTSAELRVLGVAVEPLQVAPGGAIELRVTYSLAGVPAGQKLEVLERRVILRAEQSLTTLEARVPRHPGTHESRQPLRVPADLTDGIYELRVTVEGPGTVAEGSTVFQVISSGG